MNGLHKTAETRVKARIIFLVITFILLVFGTSDKVSAFVFSTTPEITYDNYDVIMKYKNEGVITGDGQISFKIDLSNMTTFEYSRYTYIAECQNCKVSHFPYTSLIRIDLNNYNYLYDNDHSSDDPNDKSNWRKVTYSITNQHGADSTVTIYYTALPVKCKNCGREESMKIYFDGLTFIGKRGHATFDNSTADILPGGQIVVSPNFDENASTVKWGIRYPGESGFTLLTEGVNANGITASGVTNKSLTVSNIPYVNGGFDLGVFVYTQSGDLPGGYDFPNTPYYMHVNCKDVTPPSITINKNVNPSGGAVSVSISATDEGGLADKPYSFDGGVTYVSENTKNFDKVGTYQVAVKDKSGNITKDSFYIDSKDIKSGGTPSGGNGSLGNITEKDAGSKNGSGGGTNSGGGTGTGGAGDPSGNGGTSNGGVGGNSKGGTGSLDSSKTDSNDHVTGGSTSSPGTNSSSGKDVKEVGTGKSSNGGIGNDKNSKGNNLSPSEIDEKDSEDEFEKIKGNSEDYIISMQENSAAENDADAEDATVNMNSIDSMENGDGSGYTDSGNLYTDSYNPDEIEDSSFSILLIIIISAIIVAMLAFILFFGVVIFAEKETELSSLNGTAGRKVPVAISFITINNKKFSICFRELFEKYDVLYARVGILFVYMFEGEKIGIQTKFKNDKKREIATETVRKEIRAGHKKSKK